MVHSVWKNIEVPKIFLKIELEYNPTIPFLSIYTKSLKAGSKEIFTSIFIVEPLFVVVRR
jgi:hypothetical protein